uniref:Uncharacterized protein n=1 Tax=Oryza punctata TaxID=4537 RepID=A0A0E0KPQ7_ORYPU
MAAYKGMISKASSVVAAFSSWLLLLLLIVVLLQADEVAAAAQPAAGREAAAAWIRRLDDTVELEPLPAELDRVQRRVLQATKTNNYVAPRTLNPDRQGCIQTCLPGSQYSVPPPGSHCDRKYYNPGC